MLAIVGTLGSFAVHPKEPKSKFIISSCLLDAAGAITLIILGALALTGHGGSVINSLNATPGGAWGMIGGGLVVFATLYGFSRFMQNQMKIEIIRARKNRQPQLIE